LNITLISEDGGRIGAVRITAHESQNGKSFFESRGECEFVEDEA